MNTKQTVLFLVFFLFFGFNTNAQSVYNAVKEKTEVELRKRIIKRVFDNPYIQFSYKHNTLSITSANKNSDGTISFEGKINVLAVRFEREENHVERSIKGTLAVILDSYEVTKLSIYEHSSDKWNWYILL